MSTTEIATQKKPELRVIIEGDEFRARIAAVLPKHLKADRMAKIAAGALARTPGLKKCTVQSFMLCMLQLSQWGLEPDGRRAHLIPYKDQCTLIIDYKGVVELVMRTGLVKNIYADVVRPGDVFRWSVGTLEEFVPHWLRQDAGKPKEAGEPVGAFCRIVFSDGNELCHVMPKAEIEQIRKASPSGGKSDSPWQKWPYEMWKKSVFKRMSKWIPWSAEIRDAIETDDENERIRGDATVEARISTTEFAGMLDAPEEEPESETIEGESSETQETKEPETSNKQPGNIALALDSLASAKTKADLKARFDAEFNNFTWSDAQELELDANYKECLAKLGR